MSRARRLSEIAKSNEPAFTGNYWWLADPSAKTEPTAPEAPVAPVEPPEKELVPAGPAHVTASVNGHRPEPQTPSPSPVAPLPVAAAPAPEPASAEPAQPATQLASRLGTLKDKLQWLGRKSRSASQD
jgi:hypothetical protein